VGVVLKSVVIVVKNVLTSGIEGYNMNERIKELAEQAGFGVRQNGSEVYTSKLEHLPITENVEKFAELIVRECITVLDENDGATHHTELLKKHFGDE
jgi:hypothetical protein